MSAHLSPIEMIRWPDWPESWSENYNAGVAKKIRDNPAAWLNSLPMYEYAFVVIQTAAEKYGGELPPFLDDLYDTRMVPILEAYYKKLMRYRVHRAILMRNYDSFRRIITEHSVIEEKAKMQKYAMQTRMALRAVAAQFIEERNGNITRAKTEDTMPDTFPV